MNMNFPSETHLGDLNERVVSFEFVLQGSSLISSSKLTNKGNTCTFSLFFDLVSKILFYLAHCPLWPSIMLVEYTKKENVN